MSVFEERVRLVGLEQLSLTESLSVPFAIWSVFQVSGLCRK